MYSSIFLCSFAFGLAVGVALVRIGPLTLLSASAIAVFAGGRGHVGGASLAPGAAVGAVLTLGAAVGSVWAVGAPGKAVPFAIDALQLRGEFFIDPGTEAYEGMIVGEHCNDNDLVVNVQKEKQLTNMRAAGSDRNIKIIPARKMSLEQALEYIDDDELVEVTPKNIRLRKIFLTELERRRNKFNKDAE